MDWELNLKYDPETDPESNNGLITKMWGPGAWTYFHSVTFNYPLNPTDEKKKLFKEFFITFGKTLPCKYCRDSYAEFITTGDPTLPKDTPIYLNTILTDDVFKNRGTLTHWGWRLHEAVNHKLGVTYGVTYEDVVARYESFRSRCGLGKKEKGCMTPLHRKAFSYRKLYLIDCPIVNYTVVFDFLFLAKERGLATKYFILHYDISMYWDKYGFPKLKRNKLWEMRNRLARHKIVHMRENAIASLETEGDYIGLPTIEELELILLFSSNLTNEELLKSALVMKGKIKKQIKK